MSEIMREIKTKPIQSQLNLLLNTRCLTKLLCDGKRSNNK